jgi:tetratricopeptide (TPR) repeat protein
LDNQISKFRKILDRNPEDLSVLMAYAEANLLKGNRFESMKAYQKVISLQADNFDVRVALAKIYFSMKNYEDTFNEVIAVLDKAPKNIEAHLLLKKLNRTVGIPENYRDILESHLDFKTSPGKVNIMQKHYEMTRRRYEVLIEDYNAHLEEDEDNPVILYNRIKALERIKLAEETLEDLTTMIGDEEEEELPAAFLEIPESELELYNIEKEYETDQDVAEILGDPESVQQDNLEYLSDPVMEDEDVSGELELFADDEDKAGGESVELEQAGLREESETLPGEDSEVVEDMYDDSGIEDISDDNFENADTDIEMVEEPGVPASEDELVSETDENLSIQDQDIEVIEDADVSEDELIETEQAENVSGMEPLDENAGETEVDGITDIEAMSVEEVDGAVVEIQPDTGILEAKQAEMPEELESVFVSDLSPERMDFYRDIKDKLGNVLSSINKTRGISTSFIMDEIGTVVHSRSTEKISLDELSEQILPGIKPIIHWQQDNGDQSAGALNFWVLEFKKGLMVFHPIRKEIFLVVLGAQGANFGGIRFSIEKNAGDIEKIFENMPA